VKDFDPIDALLLARVEPRWRKVAFIVGRTMIEAEAELAGENDLSLAERIRWLSASGKVESRGDLFDLHGAEIRAPRGSLFGALLEAQSE